MGTEIPDKSRNLSGDGIDVPTQASNSNELEDRITPEIARQDIERIMEVCHTLGAGSDVDRAAQLVVQSLQVVRNRLDDTKILKMLYIDKPDAAKLLPGVIVNTITQLCRGEISAAKAGGIFDEAIPQYLDVFQAMGVKPEKISVLFSAPEGKEPKL